MRAWYGCDRHWFIVALPWGSSAKAYGWSEDSMSWEYIGLERTDWVASRFGREIDLDKIPADVRELLPNRRVIQQLVAA